MKKKNSDFYHTLFSMLQILCPATCCNWETRDYEVREEETACPLQVCGRYCKHTGGRADCVGD